MVTRKKDCILVFNFLQFKSFEYGEYTNQKFIINHPKFLFQVGIFLVVLNIIISIFREPRAYVQDVFNYLDLSGYSLILTTFVFRFLGSNAQWHFASFAILINFIGVFKYSIASR